MAQPPLIALRDAHLALGPDVLLDRADLALTPGLKAVLVGRNGSGKSTLLKALAGQRELDAGERTIRPGTVVGYLEQDPDLSRYDTVGDYVLAGLPPSHAGEVHRAEIALTPLGLAPDRPTGGLSGGEARRAALARAIAGDPDVLLLDEPTNHLDLPAIEWLEGYLKAFRGALLVISHDRRLLAAVAAETLLLDRGQLVVKGGGFGDFDAWLETRRTAEAARLANLDRKIAQEGKWAVEGITARRKRNQGRLRALQAMRAERAGVIRPAAGPAMAASDAAKSGRLVIEAEHIAKRFGDRVLLRDFSTRVMRGDRIGVIGPNGAGKTTLVRLLIGALAPDAGHVRLGSNLVTAWFDQKRAQLDPEATLKETLLPKGGDQVIVNGKPRHIASYLGDFLFDPSRFLSPVRSLSGGERNRLLLAKLFLSPANLLVMDEPTNDLDMETLDLLEDVLGDFPGTLILVSHDRDFLDRLVTSTIALEGDGNATEYAGGYSDYLSQRGLATSGVARTPDRPAKRPGGKSGGDGEKPARRGTKLSYKDQRDLDLLPDRVTELEREIAAARAALADAELYRREPERFRGLTAALERLEAEKDAAEERWLEVAALAEEIGA